MKSINKKLLTLLVLIQSVAHATTFFERPFPETVKEAPLVARGKTGASISRWAELNGGGRRIYTYTEFQVEEVLKGSLNGARNIFVRELGGEIDGVGMQVSGTAQFRPGEDVVVFLGDRVTSTATSEIVYEMHGMMMGKYNVDAKECLSGAGLSAATHPALRGADMHNHHEQKESQKDTSPESKWCMDRLKELIKTQEAQDKLQNNAVISPTPSPVVSPSVNPMTNVIDSDQAANEAPALQNTPPEAAASTWAYILVTLGSVMGVLLFIFWLKKK